MACYMRAFLCGAVRVCVPATVLRISRVSSGVLKEYG